MTPFEEALAAGGPLVAAWDFEDNERQRLVLVKVGSAGWTKLAETDVPEATQEAMYERLANRGVRFGATYAGSGFVWLADELGFGVWNEKAQTASGKVASPVVAKVHVTYEGGAPDRRAVAFDLKSGGTDVVAEDRSMWPSQDITYDQSNLEMDTLWAHYLSLHLALWHLVPVVNDISPYSADNDLAVARAARELAKTIGKLPDAGAFEPVTQAFGPLGKTSALALVVAPSSDAATRTLEVRVTSASGKTTSSATVKRGTNAQLVGFLRRVTTPGVVLRAVSAVLTQQQRDEA